MAVTSSKEPGLVENAKIAFFKNAPGLIGRGIQLAMMGFVALVRFIQQLFRDALGK